MSGLARTTFVGLLLVASLVFAVSTTRAAPSCMPLGAQTSCTFTYSGAPEPWVVPAGVTSAVFAVYGAQGGNYATMGNEPGGSGGKGGAVVATLALTPGATLNMRVGGKGSDALRASAPFTVRGGFNGGGTNSCVVLPGVSACTLGGAGGGSSDVRTSADLLANRLLAAAGGGGAGAGGVST